MPVGLGAGGALGVALETSAAPGTWVTPAVSVPILSENLNYTEDRYYSTAIRQQTITNAVAQGYYHVEGDLVMEFDTRYVPYFLHGSRLGVTKTGAGTPWTYTFAPTSGAIIPATNRTLSITVVRNGIVWGYAGCVVTSIEIVINGGILEFHCHVIGRSEAVQTFTPSFTAPQLLGAAAHSIGVGDGALATGAMAGTTVDQTFNGFSFAHNDNGAAQNRIIQSRAAAYISMGISEPTVTTELDFLNRTEYDKFVATSSKRLQFISSNGANDQMTLNIYNSVYSDYAVALGTWDSLVMANSVFRVISSGGSNPPFDLSVTGTSNITPA